MVFEVVRYAWFFRCVEFEGLSRRMFGDMENRSRGDEVSVDY